MNLSNLPTWFWIAAGVIAYFWATKRGLLAPIQLPQPTATTPAPVVYQQQVPIQAVDGPTEIRRIPFEFQITVTPVPRPPATPPPG